MSVGKQFIYKKLPYLFLAMLAAPGAQALADDESGNDGKDGIGGGSIVFYGNIDVDLTYQTHGTPPAGAYPAGTETVVMKNSNKSVFTVGQNGSSSTLFGFKGSEDLGDGWKAIFKAESGFSPLTGQLYDGLKALSHNNGVALNQQTTGGDNGRAGQLFNSDEYIGISSDTYGTLTFGRNPAFTMDDGRAYDPMGNAPGTAMVGILNSFQGMGDTEDYRPDASVKYSVSGIGPFHFGALYQPYTPAGTARGVEEVAAGVDYGRFTSDFTYNKNRGAIAATSLSTAALAAAHPGMLAGTVSDNTTYSAVAKYDLDPVTFYAAWQHIYYANPSTPLPVGALTIGGYQLGTVNNNAYTNNKVLTIWWTGARYKIGSRLTLNGVFYQFRQNSYFKDDGCNSAAISNACAGSLNAASFRADYSLSRKMTAYAGAMYSWVLGGYANGYLHNNTVSPVAGIRYSF